MKAFFNSFETLQELCKSVKKWGMYISLVDSMDYAPKAILQAAPYLEEDIMKFWSEGRGYFLFNSEREMLEHFNQTVGDDGPTEFNGYVGEIAIFACTCSPFGDLLSSNT